MRALGATLGALRCALDAEDARAMARCLPRPLAHVLERAPNRPMAAVANTNGLYAEVGRRERIGLGFAMEHAQVVLEALGRALPEELVARLRGRMAPDIAALLRRIDRTPSDPPPHVHEHPGHPPVPAQTLSRAHPGAAESIADARHELAHAASVARSAAPHAERMVETARSTRPGREDDTLAATRGTEENR
jgi:uncharacterized protein (DUF2267 family)